MKSDILDKISVDLMIPPHSLIRLISSAPDRYKVYEIAKRNSHGMRIIAQPAREVKPLQYWVMENLIQDFPIHDCAKAYRKSTSILDNALPHRNNSHILKMDFENFFISISEEDFRQFHREYLQASISDVDLEYIIRILFWRPRGSTRKVLSVGAPSSPGVSNSMVYNLDCSISKICAEGGAVYTRYADDITLSANSPNILADMARELALLLPSITYPRLRFNKKKTTLVSKRFQRRITGLIITNDGTISVGRDKKRTVRAMVHNFVRGKLTPDDVFWLHGYLAHLNVVEPEFIERLTTRYGKEFLVQLKSIRRRQQLQESLLDRIV